MNNLRKLSLLALVLLLTFFIAHATAFAGDCEKCKCEGKIVIGEKALIESKVLAEKRQVLINLPKGYDLAQSKYPVLYLLDGESHFLYTTGIVNFLSTRGYIPELIVVGVVNTDRTRDCTPTKVEKKNSGGADNFLSFLKEELVPYVDQNYRTEPYKIIFGHSLSGMFGLYALLNTHNVFDAYLTASPWTIYDDSYLVKFAETALDKEFTFHKFLYMTVGDEPDLLTSLHDFETLLKEKASNKLDWQLNIMKDEDHGSITFATISNGLRQLYSGWRLPKEAALGGVDAIHKHYAQLSDKFGYTVGPPENLLNDLGYKLMAKDKLDQAIEVLKLNVKNYPESANVYDSLGEAYEANKQLDLAIKNYTIAIEKAETVKHYYLKVYKEHLERAKKVMSQE